MATTRAEIFDLGGQRMFDSGPSMGNALDWRMMTESGDRVAKGVYLYVINSLEFRRGAGVGFGEGLC